MIDMMELFKWFTAIALGISIGVFFAFALVYRSYPEQKNAVVSSIFNFAIFGRYKETRHLADRIRTGQSSAIIGFFSEERTSILGYLRNEDLQQREELYGDKADKLIFSYIDIAFLDKECSPVQFWEIALEALRRKIAPGSELDKAYQECKNNQFNKLELENLISLVNQQSWRLVLLLDKFEQFLEHPNFKDEWAFFTTLRYLAASRTPSPLVLIIASNQSLKQFHEQTQRLSPLTSPVLNFLERELTILGGLSETEIDKLLDYNEPPLSQKVRQFIKNMVGGHPYLLNVAVSELWKISPNGELESVEMFEKAFYTRIQNELEDEIKALSTRTCQAFFAVLQQGDVSSFQSELKELETQGLIAKINQQWQIRSHIFSKFLADKNGQQILES